MKIRIANSNVSLFLRVLRHTLLAAGLLILVYCAFVYLDSWAFQKQESREFDHLLSQQREALPDSAQPAPPPQLSPAAHGLIGRMEIPRLGLSAIVFEGTSRSTLRRAVGHIAETALPGQPGNVGISGHRDTFFRPLRNIKKDDIITLTTLSGEYRYRVVSTKIVPPSDVAVLDSGKDEVLTLVTCYPFYFLGNAPDRFIVRAERVS